MGDGIDNFNEALASLEKVTEIDEAKIIFITRAKIGGIALKIKQYLEMTIN